MSDEPKIRHVEGDGLRLRALEWEMHARSGAALLVHATSFCADAWGPLWREAREHGAAPLRGVAIDQRGHGGSDAPDDASAYQWTRLAADVAAVAAQLAAEQPGARLVGVGHSSGAAALLAAAGLAPERFAALVVIEPVLFEKPADARAESFLGSRFLAGAARRRRDRFASLDEARERLRAKPPLAGFDAAVFDAVLAGALAPAPGGGVALCCPGEREAWCYEGAAALDLWPLVAHIRAPLLLVEGEHGAVAPALRDRLVAALPSVQSVSIPHATHFAALERPREIGAALGAFLAECLRS
jgi:pimeloyl-ACP methyl ester carboxylesterase